MRASANRNHSSQQSSTNTNTNTNTNTRSRQSQRRSSWNRPQGGSPHVFASGSGANVNNTNGSTRTTSEVNSRTSNMPTRPRDSPPVHGLTDEEYARQLQAELVQEARTRQQALSATAAASAPSPTASPGARPPPAVAPDYISPRNGQTRTPRASSEPPVATVIPICRNPTVETTSSSSSFEDDARPEHGVLTPSAAVREASVLADAVYAKRLQQELQDAEVARQIQAQEQRRSQSRQVRGVVVNPSNSSNNNAGNTGRSRTGRTPGAQTRALPPTVGQLVSQDHRGQPRPCCRCVSRCISFVICMSVAIVLGVVAYVYLSGNSFIIPGTDIDVSDIGGNWGDIFMDDPWEYGPGGNGTIPQTFWRTSGDEGLELTIINALSNEWHQYFDRSILDWDNGNPDALTLKVEVDDPDPICEPVSGKMKVCNGEYGLTGWKGINEVLVTSRGFITVSVAKMNESYLTGSSSTFGMTGNSDAERQYTMCHEIGHGFGLNHADENFNNRDLGTCMDYTNRPQNNLTPNTQNYETLATLYGTVPGSSGSASNSNLAVDGGSGGEDDNLSPKSKAVRTGDGDGRSLAVKSGTKLSMLRGRIQVTSQFMPRFNFTSFADETIENRILLWTKIPSHHPGKAFHARRFDNGFVAVAQLLLAENSDV